MARQGRLGKTSRKMTAGEEDLESTENELEDNRPAWMKALTTSASAGNYPVPLTTVDQSAIQPTDVASDAQVLWLTFRLQSSSDQEATGRYNDMVGGELDQEQVNEWWGSTDFQALATAILKTPKQAAFRNLTSYLFPSAVRAMMKLINSNNPWAMKNGVELLFRLNGMLIDKKVIIAPDITDKLQQALRKMDSTPVIRVYDAVHAPKMDVMDVVEAEVVDVSP